MPSRLSPLELHYRKADRIMLMVLWLMFLYSLGLALWHGTWGQALLVGGGTAAVMTVLQQLIAGRRLLRCAIGAAFMVMSALHINQAGGMLEMHFGIFVLLAFLVYYRDWLPIVVAAAVIAVHHLGFYALQTQGFSVTVVAQGSWPIIFLHAFYVVLESAILIYLALQTHAEAVEGAALMQTAEQLTENDDAIDLSYRSNAEGKVSKRFNRFLDTLDELVGEVIKDTQGLQTMGDNLAQATGHLRSGADRQQGEIVYMSSAMQQMSSAIDEVAGHADGAASAAQTANQQAAEGSRSVNHVRSEIGKLAAQIDVTEGEVQALANQSEQIGKVLEVIRSIAEQTNLLALNAAIEAARAGEQGRGFAVVADEVRNLAQKTAASTAEIQQIIQRLQNSANGVLNVMTVNGEKAQSSIERSVQATQMLDVIAQAVGQINELNAGIAQFTQEQIGLSSSIQQETAVLQGDAQATAHGAQATARLGEQLVSTGDHLRAATAQFRV